MSIVENQVIQEAILDVLYPAKTMRRMDEIAKRLPNRGQPIPVIHPTMRGRLGYVFPKVGFRPIWGHNYWQGLKDFADKKMFDGGTITKYDDIINARAAGKYDDPPFVKTTYTPAASGAWMSFFRIGGQPPSISPSNIPGGSVMNRASTGAIALVNPTSPDKKYLLTVGATIASVSGVAVILLVDLLVACANISLNSTSAQTVNSAALTRYTTGEGVQIIYLVTTAAGTTAANVTTTYTNQAGTTGRSTGAVASIPASCAANRLVPTLGGFMIPLASGDMGVRVVETVTLSAATGAGVADVYLFKPIAFLPLVAANTYVERDSTVQIDALTELVFGSDNQVGCLGFFGLPGGTSATTLLAGMLRTCMG